MLVLSSLIRKVLYPCFKNKRIMSLTTGKHQSYYHQVYQIKIKKNERREMSQIIYFFKNQDDEAKKLNRFMFQEVVVNQDCSLCIGSRFLFIIILLFQKTKKEHSNFILFFFFGIWSKAK